MLHVEIVDVSNSLSNLASWQSATELEHVLANIGINRIDRLSVKEGVVEMVATTNDLNIIDVMTIDGWQAYTTVVHLPSENLVSKEVVTENSAVRVGEVVRVSFGNIWQVSEHGVHRVVLLVDIIQMTGVLINSVGSE